MKTNSQGLKYVIPLPSATISPALRVHRVDPETGETYRCGLSEHPGKGQAHAWSQSLTPHSNPTCPSPTRDPDAPPRAS